MNFRAITSFILLDVMIFPWLCSDLDVTTFQVSVTLFWPWCRYVPGFRVLFWPCCRYVPGFRDFVLTLMSLCSRFPWLCSDHVVTMFQVSVTLSRRRSVKVVTIRRSLSRLYRERTPGSQVNTWSMWSVYRLYSWREKVSGRCTCCTTKEKRWVYRLYN